MSHQTTEDTNHYIWKRIEDRKIY